MITYESMLIFLSLHIIIIYKEIIFRQDYTNSFPNEEDKNLIKYL